MKLKVDKTLAASIALHVLVIGWGLVSFSTKAFESVPEESLPVDIISADQLAKVTAGMKTGKKENPKPLVEKVAEAKPVDDAVGKITEKAPVVTDTAPPPAAEGRKKSRSRKSPIRRSRSPRQAEGRAEADEKKPEPPKVDPIAEALKKEEKKPPPKPQAAGRQAAGAGEAEDGADLRSVEDRGAARQARSVAAGRDRRHAEFERRARPRPGQGRGQFRDLGFDVQAAGRALLEEALWRHRVAEA